MKLVDVESMLKVNPDGEVTYDAENGEWCLPDGGRLGQPSGNWLDEKGARLMWMRAREIMCRMYIHQLKEDLSVAPKIRWGYAKAAEHEYTFRLVFEDGSQETIGPVTMHDHDPVEWHMDSRELLRKEAVKHRCVAVYDDAISKGMQ
jgi:hypothetical protein